MEVVTSSNPSSRNISSVSTSTGSTKPSNKSSKPIQPTETVGGPPAAGVSKRKQSKSRNGCITCKAKRLKCDESKPTCQQCARRSVPCGGYKKDFKWRPVGEVNFNGKPSGGAPFKSMPYSRERPIREERLIELASPTSPAHPSLAHPMSFTGNSTVESDKQTFSQNALSNNAVNFNHSYPIQPFQGNFGPYRSNTEPSPRRTNIPFPRTNHTTSIPSTTTLFNDTDTVDTKTSSNTAPSSHSSEHSPTAIDLAGPSAEDFSVTENISQWSIRDEFIPETFNAVFPERMDEDEDEDEEEVEEIEREPFSTPTKDSWVMRIPSTTQTSPSEASVDIASFLHWMRPSDNGRVERLAMNYDRNTCGILSMMDGPNENPWRTLMWPIAKDNKALFHALVSMTSFHTCQGDERVRIQGIEHMRASIKALRQGIQNMRVDEAMATTLALAFAESWDSNISTGIQHIKGAKVLFNTALIQHRRSTLSAEELVRLKFLCNSWIYLDVIARLTSVDDDESNDFDEYLSIFTPPSSTDPHLDPLMGVASSLFPIIGRVANLVRRVRRPGADTNSPSIISQGVELKAQLESWMPASYHDDPRDPSLRIQDCLSTAEAYRYATLLHLHQAVPEMPSLTCAELSRMALNNLACVQLKSRAVIVHIYPLMAAGCEAVNQEDRDWVLGRWNALAQRMKIGIIDRCVEVVKEVWNRRDVYREEQGRVFGQTSTAVGWGAHDNSMDTIEGERGTANDRCEWPKSFMIQGYERRSSSQLLDREYMVNGSLHWLGVMKERGWEVLLG